LALLHFGADTFALMLLQLQWLVRQTRVIIEGSGATLCQILFFASASFFEPPFYLLTHTQNTPLPWADHYFHRSSFLFLFCFFC
jgi:hypothetical protein